MKKIIALIILAFSCIGVLSAQGIVRPMSSDLAVNDYTGIFSASQIRELNDSLTAFKRATSNEIVVVMVNDLGNYDVSEYAMNLLREWGVGSKQKNNGVVVVIKPRNENGGGKVYISVGYGLEGALPDGRCGRIMDNDMMPYLKKGDYYGAAVAGTEAVRKAIQGEYTADGQDGGDYSYGIFVVLFIVFIIVMAVASKKGGSGGGDGNSGGSGGGWVPPIFMGGFGGGRSSGGGGFGGGFGGFGGGSGGGGGAGRSF